jgi:predicted TPR repeat methyltransferase
VLDLGCGTGVCGLHLAGACDLLVGVDVSPAMLAKARERNLYHQLEQSDIEEYLRHAPAQCFDAVLAADVFVYLGDLAAIFRAVARVLKQDGVYALSIEETARQSDFVL